MPDSFLDLITLRSFSNIWYWLMVTVYWGHVMQAPLGVPAEYLRAARAGDRVAAADLSTLAVIGARRRLGDEARSPAWRVALWAFLLTALGSLSLGYGIEIAQAVFLIAAPAGLVAWFTDHAARRILTSADPTGEAGPILGQLKLRLQILGIVAVFVTALWGSYHTLSAFTL